MGVTAKGQIQSVSTKGSGDLSSTFTLKAPTKVLIRALGPSLQGGVPDPSLALLYAGGAVKARNDDFAPGNEMPPTNKKESAILGTLKPAKWTAIASAKGAQGILALEVIDLTPAPVIKKRDYNVGWAYVGPAKQFRVFWTSASDHGDVTVGDLRTVKIPNLIIGNRYFFVVDYILDDGTENGISGVWSCLITPTGCQQ